MQDHSDSVTAVTVHATGDYFVTASADRSWAFYDVATGTCYTQASLSLPPEDPLPAGCVPHNLSAMLRSDRGLRTCCRLV